MILLDPIQTAGNANVSEITGVAIQTQKPKKGKSITWSYNRAGDLELDASLKPADVLGNPANPTNNYRSSNGKVIYTLEYLANYNRLAIDFSSTVRTIPLVSNTIGISQRISLDPADSSTKLLRVVAQSGATPNSTLRIYLNNASAISQQIDITLPAANTRYLIDDIDWLTPGTYGVVNTPVTVDGMLKGTTTAIVTTNGTLPPGGKYLGITAVGTLDAELIETAFYNNEFQKYGAKVMISGCCKTETLPKIEKQLQDIICGDKVTATNLKAKTGTLSFKLQKSSAITYGFLQSSEVYEENSLIKRTVETVTVTQSGSNVVIPYAGLVSSMSIGCQPLVQNVNNLTSADLSKVNLNYNWSLNTTTNEIVLPNSITVGTEIEVAYFDNLITQSMDLMEIKNELPMLWYYTVKDVTGTQLLQYEILSTSATVTDSLGEDSDTIDVELTISAEENRSFRRQAKI